MHFAGVVMAFQSHKLKKKKQKENYCCCCHRCIKPLKRNLIKKKKLCGAAILTSPSVDLMLASCTTSKCAAWDTMGSDDSEMMWSQTPDKVLHWVVGGRWEIMLSREWNVPWWLRCHEVSTLTTCRILFSVSYTEQSWGEYSEKHSYLWRTRPKLSYYWHFSCRWI